MDAQGKKYLLDCDKKCLKLSEFNAKRINPIFTRDAWRLADQEILDIYHRLIPRDVKNQKFQAKMSKNQQKHDFFRMNLRDATKIINKADTGIMLNRSEQKLAELMLQGNSLADINQQDSSTSNLRLNLDENADLGKFDKKECIKVKHDANLHHMLVVRI